MSRRPIVCSLLLILLTALVVRSADEIDLHDLIGVWNGGGGFVMPVTGIRMEIDGSAEFIDVPDSGFIKTTLNGSKFLFNYSDSGHLWIDSLTDSLTWEIWDGFGRHVTYYGIVDGNEIRGSRQKGKSFYFIQAEMIGPDSLSFRLRAGATEDPSDKAWFNLGRKR